MKHTEKISTYTCCSIDMINLCVMRRKIYKYIYETYREDKYLYMLQH